MWTYSVFSQYILSIINDFSHTISEVTLNIKLTKQNISKYMFYYLLIRMFQLENFVIKNRSSVLLSSVFAGHMGILKFHSWL
jgi:hypothetical protein